MMTTNETIMANALTVITHTYDGKNLTFEQGGNFILHDEDNTVRGTYTVSIRESHCIINTSPTIGNIEVGLIIKSY